MKDSPGNNEIGSTRGAEARGKAGDASLGILDGYIGFYLRLAQNAAFKAFQRQTGEHDLRPGWFTVLMLIHVNPGITPMALSRASGRDKSTLTPVLRDLEHHKFVDRCPMPNDKRSHSLALTPAGEEMLAKLAAHAAAHERKLDEVVGYENKAAMIRMLRQIASQID